MNELKLTELGPYLPYGLKAEMLRYESDYVGKRYDTIVGIHQWDKSGSLWCALTVGGSKPGLGDIKPILRPLSDLTREIEHNGEKFIPLYALMKDDKAFTTTFIEAFGYEELKVSVYEKLLSWHFDVFNLLERNLAVDYNTVNETT